MGATQPGKLTAHIVHARQSLFLTEFIQSRKTYPHSNPDTLSHDSVLPNGGLFNQPIRTALFSSQKAA